MDILGLIGIIFVGIIISAISAASKKKQSENSEEGGAPKRPVMSDIQRAFMMMSGQDDENERRRDEVLRGFNAPPVSRTPADSEGFAGAEGSADSEGKSDFGSVPSGSLRGDTPIEQAGYKGSYSSAPSGSIRGNTAIEAESGVYKYAAAAEDLKEAAETVKEDEASRLTDLMGSDMEHRLDESFELADIAETNKENMLVKRKAKPALKLFENKNDYVKAIILSEVLSRRPPVGRAAAKH